jgi:hypothetical protein
MHNRHGMQNETKPREFAIPPWPVVASLPFAPEIVIDTLHHAIERLVLKGYKRQIHTV